MKTYRRVIKRLGIEKLMINPENYRFDPVDTQPQAIDLMLEEKGDEIINLARDIVENGIDEAKNFRVIEIKKDLFKVLEGNRRATCLKCLQDPSLVKSESLRSKFEKLVEDAKKNSKTISSEANCFVYKTEEEAAKWIKLDHTGENKGVGLVKWDVAAQNRFAYQFEGKLSPAMQAIRFLEHETKTKFDSKELKKLKISTINRILSNVEARSYLGISFSDEELYLTSKKKEVVDRLNKLFNKIIVDDVPVRELYTAELTTKFMKNLFGDKPESSKELTKVSRKVYAKKGKKKKSLPRTNSRNTVIPYDFELQIHESKINNIFLNGAYPAACCDNFNM